MSERTYTNEEVVAIFAKAARRRSQSASTDESAGLTLAEIEQAGIEAGLDPAAIRNAASEIELRQRFPTRCRVAVAERWIETPVNDGAWEDLIASLRHRFGNNSAWWAKDTSSIGKAQEWTHSSASGVRTTVTLSPRDERTLLRLVQEDGGFEDERRTGWLLSSLLGVLPAILTGAFVAETLEMGDLIGVATVVLVLMAVVAFGAPLITARARQRREQRVEQVQQIADELTEQILRPRSQLDEQPSGEIPTTQIDQSAREESGDEVGSSHQHVPWRKTM
jgi:hypothetical protein